MLPRALLLLIVLAGSAIPRAAHAVVDFCDLVQFPFCLRDFGSCEFDLDYGNTGGLLLLGSVRVDDGPTLINPQVEGQTVVLTG